MKVAMGREKYLTVVLALVALVLGGVLYWEWDQGVRLEQDLLKLRKIPVTSVPGQALLPEFTLPDAESGFPELISRSLFTVGRRSSAGAKGGKGAMKKGQFVLVGVLITPSQRSALLRDVQTNKTETVALVGVVRGMTLGEVESSRVVLRQGAESEELVLNVQIGPKGPTAPQSMPAQQPATPVASPPLPPASGAPIPVRPPGAPTAGASAPARPAESASNPIPPSLPPGMGVKK
jgi:hypothetical protein